MSPATEDWEPGWAIALKSSTYECREMSYILDDADIECDVREFETGALLLVRPSEVERAQAAIKARRDRREERIARYLDTAWGNRPALLLHTGGMLLSIALFIVAGIQTIPLALRLTSLAAVVIVWWGIRRIEISRL